MFLGLTALVLATEIFQRTQTELLASLASPRMGPRKLSSSTCEARLPSLAWHPASAIGGFPAQRTAGARHETVPKQTGKGRMSVGSVVFISLIGLRIWRCEQKALSAESTGVERCTKYRITLSKGCYDDSYHGGHHHAGHHHDHHRHDHHLLLLLHIYIYIYIISVLSVQRTSLGRLREMTPVQITTTWPPHGPTTIRPPERTRITEMIRVKNHPGEETAVMTHRTSSSTGLLRISTLYRCWQNW